MLLEIKKRQFSGKCPYNGQRRRSVTFTFTSYLFLSLHYPLSLSLKTKSSKKRRKDPTMETNCSFISCEKIDRAANWVGSNVASAFFASLERCSCINLGTTDLEEDEIDEAHDRPFLLSKPIIADSEPSTPKPTIADSL
ncbi:hypothetical protein ACB092_12G158900 [Castanea dentata]